MKSEFDSPGKPAPGLKGLGEYQPVLLDFHPTPGIQKTQSLGKKIGIKNFYPRGGCIRDAILENSPRDHDAICDVWSFSDQSIYDGPDLCASLEQKFRSEGLTYELAVSSTMDIRYLIDYEGINIDLCFSYFIDGDESTRRKALVLADTPLNGLILDSGGACYAHPLATNHLRNMVCVYDQHSTPERANHLITRLPGLRIYRAEDLPDCFKIPDDPEMMRYMMRHPRAQWPAPVTVNNVPTWHP